MNEDFIDHGEQPDSIDEDMADVSPDEPPPFGDAIGDGVEDEDEDMVFDFEDDEQATFPEVLSHSGGDYNRGGATSNIMSIMTSTNKYVCFSISCLHNISSVFAHSAFSDTYVAVSH